MDENAVYQALSRVIDPEIGVDIVNLGLVYTVKIDESRILVQMTMTTPACPLHGYILRHAENELSLAFPDQPNIRIELVWEPQWHPLMMSPAARTALGWNA
jgi:metal-sulfur cluster biosynthetic enzyme